MAFVLALTLTISRALAASPNLKMYIYDFSSEKSADWIYLTSNVAATGNEVLALAKNKTDGDQTLVMFRRSEAGDRVCEKEKSQIKPAGFKKLGDVKGWSCVFRTVTATGVEQLTAIRSMIIRGRHLKTSFAIILSAQKMKTEKFVALLKSAKEHR